MKYSLGFQDNYLNFRDILEQGRSVIINLAIPEYPDASQLFGCLLTVGRNRRPKPAPDWMKRSPQTSVPLPDYRRVLAVHGASAKT
jgi:hypothetical protein